MKGVLRLLPTVVLEAVMTLGVRLCACLVQAWRWTARGWGRSMGVRGTAVVLAALVLAVLSTMTVDRPVALAMQTADAGLLSVMELVTQLGDSAGYITGGILMGLLFWWLERAYPALGARWRFALWSRRSAYFAATVIVSGLLSILLKYVFGRPRPRMLFREELYGFQPFTLDTSADFASFPSGHSTTIWSVAIALILIFRRRAWIMLPLALLVSSTRVVLTDHYIGDVIAGAVLGGVTAILLLPVFRIGTDRGGA